MRIYTMSRDYTNPVKKNMDKFHKPKTHKDKTKYKREQPKRNHTWQGQANTTKTQ